MYIEHQTRRHCAVNRRLLWAIASLTLVNWITIRNAITSLESSVKVHCQPHIDIKSIQTSILVIQVVDIISNCTLNYFKKDGYRM